MLRRRLWAPEEHSRPCLTRYSWQAMCDIYNYQILNFISQLRIIICMVCRAVIIACVTSASYLPNPGSILLASHQRKLLSLGYTSHSWRHTQIATRWVIVL